MKSIAKQFSLGNFIGYFVAMLCAFILTACGGGGGNPGINPNQPTTPNSRVTSLVITTSSTSIPASGTPGTEVTVTVLARDANNTAVPGAVITINADSGAISFVASTDATAMPGVTDLTGTVMAKLSIAGVATLRNINVTAASGSVRSETKTVAVVAATNFLSVASSSDTLSSSGSVLITVLVRGPSNNVLTGAKVGLISDSGALIFIPTGAGGSNATDPTLTDANGMVAATLTPGNNIQPRLITVTATLDRAAGTSTPATKTVSVVTPATPSLIATANTGNLVSSGAAGTEVMVTVLARDANNNVLPNVPVTISANSGVLTVMSRTTDATGLVRATLGTGGDPSLRSITVNTSTTGVQAVPLTINVIGTKITLGANASVNAGSSSEMTVNLVDSNGVGISNRIVSFSSANGGTVVVKNGGMAKTDSAGQLVLVFTPKAGTASDTVTVSALNSSDSKQLIVNNTNSFVKAKNIATGVEITKDNINTCFLLAVHNDVAGVPTVGNVSLSSSRGRLFSDPNCQNSLSAALPLVNGDAIAYFNSSTPGVTTFIATLSGGGTTQGAFEFVAPLTVATRLTLQADPAVIGANIGTDQSQKSTVRVVVRDGTAANNVVSGATVNFSIVNDGSGGFLSQPSVVTTGPDGSATVNYIAGSNPTAAGGVTLQAQIANSGTTAALATTSLTVARRALFITAGTGNTIGVPSGESYSQNYQVLVTDAAGNPVPGATVTASVVPVVYGKGVLVFDLVAMRFVRASNSIFCPNEDVNLNGILESGEDINNNGRLEPGIPIALTVGGQTDGTGTTLVTLRYARDQANWLNANLMIRASVSGSESLYVANFTLAGVAADFSNQAVSPPGVVSPYGSNLDCTRSN